MPDDDGRLSSAETARRLGIRVETLYAYVSRGLLSSTRVSGGRGSTFAIGDVDRLAASGTRRPRTRDTDPFRFPSISTSSTLVRDGGLFYRGENAVLLSGTSTFDQVTELLWGGSGEGLWTLPATTATAIRRAVRALPATVDLITCLRVGLATAAALDPLRHDLSPATVRRTARLAIAALIEAMPAPSHHGAPDLAERLLAALTSRSAAPPDPMLTGCLEAALVLLADHGLAASTVAARVAASARADPYAVIGAGLGVLDSPLHGAASVAARTLLTEIDAGVDPGAVVGARLRAGQHVPGIGHPLYPLGDPRAAALLERLTAVPAAARWLTAVRSVEQTVAGRGGTPGANRANIDLALAALTLAGDLPAEGGEVIFGVARTAGWIAHALEEYREQPLRWRGRELYTGTEPTLG